MKLMDVHVMIWMRLTGAMKYTSKRDDRSK